MNQKKRAVFLDRDGVLNHTFFRNGKPRAPESLEQFTFIPGTKTAIDFLKNAGFITVVVTNQPDVARGWQKKEIVQAMNDIVLKELEVHDLKVCFHDDQEGCDCRKPNPGMLLEAAVAWDIDLANSFMVGDRLSDIEAGNRAGCTGILIGAGDSFQVSKSPSFQTESLIQAVEWILVQK